MRRRSVLALGLAGCVLGARKSRAEDFPKESDPREGILKAKTFFAGPAKTEPFGDGLTLLTGPGGNMLVLNGQDGPLMIDAGLADRADEIRAAAEKAAGGPIAILVNTHWHGDHTGGNQVLARAGAKVIATAATKRRLSEDHQNPLFRMTYPARPPEARPGITLNVAEIQHGGEEVRLEAVAPAHTDGDLIVHFRKADVIHCGDLVNNGAYPNIDASCGGWIGGMIAGVDRVLQLAGPKTRIVPGHGPVATPDDIRAFRAMLATVNDRIGPMVAAGRSVDEVLAANPTADLDAKWGGGMFNGPMFTRIVAAGLPERRARS